MADCKYEKLKSQIEFETKCLIDNLNNRYSEEYAVTIPEDITLGNFIGDYGYIDMYDRGSLFAYLSLKSTIEMLES